MIGYAFRIPNTRVPPYIEADPIMKIEMKLLDIFNKLDCLSAPSKIVFCRETVYRTKGSKLSLQIVFRVQSFTFLPIVIWLIYIRWIVAAPLRGICYFRIFARLI